jgi:hypothetical protein
MNLLDTIIDNLKNKIHDETNNKEFLTISTYRLLNNHFRNFNDKQKQIFSELMSNIGVGFRDQIVTLSLGIPLTQVKFDVSANNTDFCNALTGFYRLLSDIKDDNMNKVIIKDSVLSGDLESRTENCYRYTRMIDNINKLRDSAMRGIEVGGQDGGGSKSRRKPARKTRRGRGPTRKSKPKTHRCRRHSRIRKHHKKYTSRRRR